MERWEYQEWIEDSILEILEDANLGVNMIIFGDRVRVNELRPPALWIVPADSRCTQSGIGEDWAYEFGVSAVVKDTDPKKGRRKAKKIASQAASALKKSHNLKQSVRNVELTGSLTGDLGGMGAEQLHSAGYVMEAKFRYLEREA